MAKKVDYSTITPGEALKIARFNAARQPILIRLGCWSAVAIVCTLIGIGSLIAVNLNDGGVPILGVWFPMAFATYRATTASGELRELKRDMGVA